MIIKIVYNTKTHIISPKYQTLTEIKTAIQTLYSQQLEKGFDLYVKLHPLMDPIKILDEACFLKFKELYNQMNQKSIKFLVKDFINPNLTNDDLSLLNQSVIAQSAVELSTVKNLFQQPQQQKQEEILNEKQQIVIEENKPELNLTQEIVYQIQKQDLQGLDYHSEEFKKFILQRIDNRLKYHGLLQPQIQQAKQREYKLELIQQDFIISKYINEQCEWKFQIHNTGDIIWRKNHVALVGTSGHFYNVRIELENDVKPGQIGQFKFLFQLPSFEIQNLKNEFQMAYNEQNQLKYFGKKISLYINAKNLEPLKEQKIKQLMESVGITFEKAKEFIQMYGFENEISEIILAYVEQPK